ncbi:hypothetical protein OUY22_08655 [Nonomuraea sp. MCN248]|uniref:DUF2746 domain-containing protein n=1 Tax=Nonomuraea corallina TaxID=2989783 RepID=A0ABT4S8I4_9ACTN|nr:hypothetical protein [Nonomuraea corallina]MDA0633486.1 hypothetical protein [Nonomuraea corallina]
MSSPQHRLQLVERVKRLESCVFTIDTDVADLKTVVQDLPTTIRQEILDYTEPVFGEIMAGRANLATREDLQRLEQRLTEKFEHRFSAVDTRLDRMDARFDAMDSRLDAMDARLDRMDARFDRIEAGLEKILVAVAGAAG